MKKEQYVIVGVFVLIIALAIVFKGNINRMVNGVPEANEDEKECKTYRVTFKFSDYVEAYASLIGTTPRPNPFDDKDKVVNYLSVVEYFKDLSAAGVPNKYEPRKAETFSFTFEAKYLEEFKAQMSARQTQLKYDLGCV